MLDGGKGLIAVSQAQLPKNGCADLLEANLKNLCLDGLNNLHIVNLDIIKVEIGGAQGGGSLVQAGLKDLSAYLHRSEHAEVAGNVVRL